MNDKMIRSTSKQTMNPPPNKFTYRGPHQKNYCDIIYLEGTKPVIDLHYMTKKEAEDWCIFFMEKYKGYVEFIVGQGYHSLNGPPLKTKGHHSSKKIEDPPVKTKVKDILKRFKITHGEVTGNPGRVFAWL